MNPHYHPYGSTELTSPHPPSPDNNNYHHHGGSGGHGPPHGGPHGMPHGGNGGPPGSGGNGGGPLSNGHVIGPGGPHMLSNAQHGGEIPHPHVHHPHPAFGGAPPPGAPQHHPHHHALNSTNNNNNNTVKICAGCGGKIVERFLLHALDRYWHNGCLKCSCCAAMLADIGSSCFTKSGMILCKTDYMRMFGNTGACSACGQTIPANELVMRTGGGHQLSAAPLPHLVFHLKCFACSKCGAHLVPGDRYYMLAGSLVCEQDWHKLIKGSTPAGGPVRKGKVGRPRRSRD